MRRCWGMVCRRGTLQAAVANYRGEECQYTGAAMFTDKDEPTDDPALDRCSGSLASCRIRHNESRFGGFPASSLT